MESVVSQATPWWRKALRGWRRPSGGELVSDAVLAVVLAAITMLEALLVDGSDQDGPPGLPLTVTLAAAIAVLAVAARRAWPILTLVGVSAVGTWLGIGYVLAVVASYGVGYRVARAGRAAAAVAFSAVVPTVISWYVMLRHLGPEYDPILIVTFVVVAMAVPALFGGYWRQRTALVAAGWERAGRLERERALIADQARLRERSRIAQDMHDSLGHELSLIALQAGALELDGDLPARHRETARLLRATTADAVARLREIVGVLRDDGEPAPTGPADEDVAGLVGGAAASGVEIRLEQEGEPGPLPPLADRALYRVVQESVTNATKHAPGAAVLVRLRHGADEVTVEVISGPARGPAPEQRQGGRGLLGLAERVRLAGGQLTAGPEGGGFRVTARLPRGVDGPAAAPGDGAAAPDHPAPLPRFEPPPTEPALVDGYASMVSRLRRRFWFKLAAPVVLLAILTVGYLVAFSLRQATLSPQQFETVRIGQSRSEVETRVPSGTPGPPNGFEGAPAPPPGTTCRYYLSRSAGWWDFERYEPNQAFRLCYAGDQLVTREILRKAGP